MFLRRRKNGASEWAVLTIGAVSAGGEHPLLAWRIVPPLACDDDDDGDDGFDDGDDGGCGDGLSGDDDDVDDGDDNDDDDNDNWDYLWFCRSLSGCHEQEYLPLISPLMMLMAMTMSFENTSDIAAGDDDDNKNTYDISADDDNCDDNDNWDYLLYGSSPCGCHEG